MSHHEANILIGVAATSSWYGKLIRKLTRSRVNHAFVLYWDIAWECWQAIQVDKRGVVIVPAKRILDQKLYTEFYRTDRDTFMYSTLHYMRDVMGSQYDWLGIFGFLLKLIARRLLGMSVENPVEKKGELFCSEFVALLLKRANLWVDVDPPSVSPKRLSRWLRNNVLFKRCDDEAWSWVLR